MCMQDKQTIGGPTMSVLIGSKEIIRKLGSDIDEIIYKHDIIRIYQTGASTFTVEKVLDGEFYPAFIKSFATLNEAEKFYQEVA